MKLIGITSLLAIILTGSCYFFLSFLPATQKPSRIKMNQLGYHPESTKIAAITNGVIGEEFSIKSTNRDTTYYTGKINQIANWSAANERVGIANFSDFQKTGKYLFVLEEGTVSQPFELKANIFADIHKASLKAFYFQRASMPIDSEYGNRWQRPSGHPDDMVMIHESAATPDHPEGSIVSAPGGWYDAGDYGKYTVNAAVSTAYLLALYERFPEKYDSLSIQIPSENSELGDLLAECYYNLKWLEHMQEIESGMVYHKLTSLSHASVCMPDEDTTQRYIIGKSTAANLDFVAVMAMASRIYKDKLPDFSLRCMTLAEKAWMWALEHPTVYFENPTDVHTGAYRDDHLEDEWVWAATELFITTQDSQYLPYIHLNGRFSESPNWQELGYFSLLEMSFHQQSLSEKLKDIPINSRLLGYANGYVKTQKDNPYLIPFGDKKYDFMVGSNSKIAGNGLLLLEAYRITENKPYLDAALACMDYLLGRNPLGYCFVTGFGHLSPEHIHHRPSQADEVEEPIPGFLAGGPNNRSKNSCTPLEFPATAYIDDWCSYSTNEVTINWNAPFTFLSGMMEVCLNAQNN